tara:strand:- start:517 stop:744 length:228 start_codon:yes stop_codon:yes gene_type:complete
MPRKKKEEVAVVEDHPELVRDLTTNAIINTSVTAYQARLNQIEKSKLDAQQSEDIVQLKKDVAEIKDLLKKIASK